MSTFAGPSRRPPATRRVYLAREGRWAEWETLTPIEPLSEQTRADATPAPARLASARRCTVRSSSRAAQQKPRSMAPSACWATKKPHSSKRRDGVETNAADALQPSRTDEGDRPGHALTGQMLSPKAAMNHRRAGVAAFKGIAGAQLVGLGIIALDDAQERDQLQGWLPNAVNMRKPPRAGPPLSPRECSRARRAELR